MRVKLNGMPWEDIQTPDMTNYTLLDFSSNPYAADTTVVDVIHTTASSIDHLNYYIMSKTPLTEEVYKMCGWATKHYAEYSEHIWSAILGL